MSENNIVLTEKEFKKVVAGGFITGYKYAMMHGLFGNISREQMKDASKPCEEELWIRCKTVYEKLKN